jgi:hypothetical protein
MRCRADMMKNTLTLLESGDGVLVRSIMFDQGINLGIYQGNRYYG